MPPGEILSFDINLQILRKHLLALSDFKNLIIGLLGLGTLVYKDLHLWIFARLFAIKRPSVNVLFICNQRQR